MINTIIQLVLISLIPIGCSVGLAFADKYTKFNKLKRIYKYIIVGLIFGGASVLGTVLGVSTSDNSIINVRDASPILAGLVFGGPAGIIAGFIGGLYRFVSVYWGGSGAYTQIACSLSTFLAGVFTALVRKFVFNDHHGKWYYGFFLGVLVEDFHMLMAFLTHMDDVTRVYNIINECALPMILVNSLAVAISMIFISLIYKEKLITFYKKRKISTRVQMTLMISLVVAYVATAAFSYSILSNVVNTRTTSSIQSVISDTKDEVDDNINNYLLSDLVSAKTIVDQDIKDDKDLSLTVEKIKTDYYLSEVSIVGQDDHIKYSTLPEYINFDMNSGDQSREFGVLNRGTEYFIQEIREPTSKLTTRMKYAGIAISTPNAKNLGYVQIGLNEESYAMLLGICVAEKANFRHVNANGFIVITDSAGNIFSAPSKVPLKIGDTLDLKQFPKNQSGKFTIKINELTYEYYTYTTYQEGYFVIGFAERYESELPIRVGFLGLTLTEILIYLLLYFVLYVIIKRKVTDKMASVSDNLNDISNGNLHIEVNERDSYEFDRLSDDINKTVHTLKGYIEKEAHKNAEELEFAKNIQHSVLPTIFPLNDTFEIFASMNTAKEVGGDFYDFYYLDREHMVIQIADVSGKGIPAAMFMMESKTILKSLIESGLDLGDAYTEANRRLCEGNEAQMFVTGWAAIINLSTGHVEYVNAGHNPPLLGHANGKIEFLKGRSGFVLAGMEGFTYHKQEFDIAPGDFIYLYTDGVTEAINRNNEQYGEKRLLEVLDNNRNDAKHICTRVYEDVKSFVDGAEQSDDITMLCFCLYKKESNNILVVEANTENIPTVTNWVDKLLEDAGCSLKAQMQIDVAIDEIISNICHYAYKEGQIGKAKITMAFDDNNEKVRIIFEDRGIPYNPLEKADPNIHASVEDRQIGGLGIFIVKKTMDSLDYESVNGHNILTLVKRIKD